MIEPNRKLIRLKDYDYSSEGGYFVTIVTAERKPLFGSIVNGVMKLNQYGLIVREEWIQTGQKRENITLFDDEFCIMPNHFHGILWITNDEDHNPTKLADTARRVPTTGFGSPVAGSLAVILGAFKSSVTRRLNELRGLEGEKVWQGRFYDHIIRDEKDYYAISEYIDTNPLNWQLDDYWV